LTADGASTAFTILPAAPTVQTTVLACTVSSDTTATITGFTAVTVPEELL